MIAEGYGGSTRIATSLKTFNDRYATETLNTRSVAIVRSDGCDTDSPVALAVELRRLMQRARRLVWLYPILGWKDYAPVARAMAVTLDYTDYFATADSLASLALLEDELAPLRWSVADCGLRLPDTVRPRSQPSFTRAARGAPLWASSSDFHY